MNRRRFGIILLLFGVAAASPGVPPDGVTPREPTPTRRSLIGHRRPQQGDLDDYLLPQSWKPTSDSGLACLGRWSYGPSLQVSLRVTPDDTIVCLARGSGASIIRFRSHDSLALDLLSDIDCNGIVSRAIMQDTLVFCGLQEGGTGFEVWGVGDLESPNRLSYVYLPSIMDIAVQDTLLYATGYVDDSLRIFSVADPRNPRWLGACADSGFPICVSGDYCYLADQYGINIVDASDPANPHRVSAIGGFEALAVSVRDTLCFVGTYTSELALRVYNVKDPTTPLQIGSLPGVEAHDIYLPPTCDTVLYTPKLHVINISNPANPRQIGYVSCPGWDYGVVVVPALNYALVADYHEGLAAVDIANPPAPEMDTTVYAADAASDISIQNGLAAVAADMDGLLLLDVTDPAKPMFLGRYDTLDFLPGTESAVLADSFAFISWPVERLQSVDVSDPTHPVRAGVCTGMFNQPRDMVLRDSFLYCAEPRRFQVVNVARPRQPTLVGSCAVGDGATVGLAIWDTFAYVNAIPGLWILSIADARAPRVIDTAGGRRLNAIGVAVRDTIAFMPSAYDTLWIISVADPTSLRYIAGVPLGTGNQGSDAAVVDDTLVYVATASNVTVVNVKDLGRPFVAASCQAPCYSRRVTHDRPHVYAACSRGGVLVLDTAATAVGEILQPRVPGRAGLSVQPNPTCGMVWLSIDGDPVAAASVRDVTGRVVLSCRPARARRGTGSIIDIGGLASGVHFVEARSCDGRIGTARIIRP